MFNRIIWIWSFYHNQNFRSLFLMLRKWIMFNSTFCVQLKVNYWLSEDVGGSPRLGILALKMFRMQTCSSTLASMLQVQYIGFRLNIPHWSCSTCFHVNFQCKWWEKCHATVAVVADEKTLCAQDRQKWEGQLHDKARGTTDFSGYV